MKNSYFSTPFKSRACFGRLLLGLFGLAVFAVSAATASSYDYQATVGIGESTTTVQAVTVDGSMQTGGVVDVLLIFDTSRSMINLLESAKLAAEEILANSQLFGDVHFAVGEFTDFPVLPRGSPGIPGDPSNPADVPWRLITDMTGAESAIISAIEELSIRNGLDDPESLLYALVQATRQVTWRQNSTRIIILFGDAPGHYGPFGNRPSLGVVYPEFDEVLAALAEASVRTSFVDYSRDAQGRPIFLMNSAPYDFDGVVDMQASTIAEATGGFYRTSEATREDLIEDIQSILEGTFTTYSNVRLTGTDLPAGITVEINPASYPGPYTRTETRTFSFQVTITGLVPGEYIFPLNFSIDGATVSSTNNRIVVLDEDEEDPEDPPVEPTIGTVDVYPSVSGMIVEGSDLSLFAETSGAELDTIQWQFFDPLTMIWVDLPGETGPQLDFGPVGMSMNGLRYRAVATFVEADPAISNIFTVVITPLSSLPIIIEQPQDQVRLVGEGVTFLIRARSEVPVQLTYRWQFQSEPGGEWTNLREDFNHLWFEAKLHQDQYRFRVWVGTPAGLVVSREAKLTVLPRRTWDRTVAFRGWLESDWFGTFYDTGDWIYHMEHGWQYHLTSSSSGLYFFDGAVGAWGFTSADYFPWFFWYTPTGLWTWYEFDGAQRRLFYPNGDRSQPLTPQQIIP